MRTLRRSQVAASVADRQADTPTRNSGSGLSAKVLMKIVILGAFPFQGLAKSRAYLRTRLAHPIRSKMVGYPPSLGRDERLTHMATTGHIAASPRESAAQKGAQERRVGKECRSRWSTYH